MIACPHCHLQEAPQFAAYRHVAGVYHVCMRCEGISIYYEASKKLGHEIALRKATKQEFASIRNTPELMLLRRFRHHYMEEEYAKVTDSWS